MKTNDFFESGNTCQLYVILSRNLINPLLNSVSMATFVLNGLNYTTHLFNFLKWNYKIWEWKGRMIHDVSHDVPFSGSQESLA